MRFSILLIISILCSTIVLSQSNVNDSLRTVNKKTGIDSPEFKKQDSLPYATLYFYRSYIPKMAAPLKKVPIYINDSLVHDLKANTFISLKVFKEGKFNIAVDSKGESEIPIKVKFGKEYFFKCEIVAGLWFGKPTIDTVTPEVGRKESGILKNE